jgi:rhodanese-related sulfurtransferase
MFMVDAPRISVDDLRKRIKGGEDFTFVDTRNPQAWGESDVMMPEAVRVPLDQLEQRISRIPKDKPVVTYCT